MRVVFLKWKFVAGVFCISTLLMISAFIQWHDKQDADREANLSAIASRFSHHILSDDVEVDVNKHKDLSQDSPDYDWWMSDVNHTSAHHVTPTDKQLLASNQRLHQKEKGSSSHRDMLHSSKTYCNPIYNITRGQEGKVTKDYKLVNIHVIIRHGDRSPFYSLPNHPYPKLSCKINRNDTDEFISEYLRFANNLKKSRMKKYPDENNCEGSQLTPRGLKQHLYNGRYLAQIYAEKLNLFGGSGKDWTKIYVRTTHYTRTYQSAWAFLYGFMGNATVPDSSFGFGESYGMNFCAPKLSGVPCYCPAVGSLDGVLKKEHYNLSTNHLLYQSVKRRVSKVLGVSLSNVPWLGAIIDVLMSYTCHNMQIPCIKKTKQCFTKQHLTDMWQASNELTSLEVRTHARIMNNDLVMYPLMREIAFRYKNITKNLSDNRMTLYSGHDHTITPLTVAFGINDAKWPPYASRVVMELYKHVNTSVYYLKVLYNGKDETHKLRFCDTLYRGLCPLENYFSYVFHDLLLLYNSNSYKKACSL